MIRFLLIAPCLLLALTQQATAQEWARKMFTATSHDFGDVARGAKTEYAFELQNIFKEPIHISGVRTSCGCTTPRVTKDTLNTWEKGAVIAHFNTDTFLGQRGATLTVTIDKPYYAEVQLSVKGYIHSDVVFQPGLVDFGSVDQGAEVARRVQVNFTGRTDWKINDVRSANPNLLVRLDEVSRGGSRVVYDMHVTLKGDAPAGYLRDQLNLVTNDRARPTIPIGVEAIVNSPLTLSPAAWFVGVVKPGQTVDKQLIIRGKKPFRVTDVRCNGDCFTAKPPSGEAKTLQFVPITFTAPATPGEMAAQIVIETDLGSATVVCEATAKIEE
ncbi:DUF1573 domain-containing protein [Lignipirellula cremea]|uniref:DUF1573 domain-containing protein n=1 Tax=Lignipirellula cremea TaxID=2528010 RepID=A0A518E1T1_9BACT|nr:DUF1573 domain-containing protein [Lignipirellula cremea]QDU98048.1 hypothetical protein Pla8534_59090 [Lignipirellula cremea]